MSELSSRLEGLSRKERAALLELMRRRKGTAAPEPAVEEERALLPSWEQGGTAVASFGQERLWLLDQIEPGTPAYNIPAAIRFRGALDLPAFLRVVQEIERRHAALRTVFGSAGGRPVQRILPVRPRPLLQIDLSALPEEARTAEARRVAAVEAARPFDLETGPLFRAALVVLGSREHLALYTMHHIVSDGWSNGILVSEVAALYEAFVLGRPSPLSELPLQYPDFARQQRERLDDARLARDLGWWKGALAGLATLELPTDRPRPPVRSGRGGARTVILPPARVEALAALARREQATLYMALLAAFQALLQRLSQQDDVAVGSPVANRNHHDVEAIIGFFVNTVVMRTDASGDPTFREMLARARQTTLGALLHQETPFEKVVEAVQPERQLARAPLFQVMFLLQNLPRENVELPGLFLERLELPTVASKFELSLACGEAPAGLHASLEFDLDLYETATAERWLRHFEMLVAGALEAPDTRLSALPLLTAGEHRQILALANEPPRPGPAPRALPDLFEEQVDRAPGAPAVTLDGTSLTWRELDARANQLARWLRDAGVVPGRRVALCLDRSFEMIAGLLAVLKAGGAYVPLDPSAPEERRAFALEDSGASLLVDAALLEREAEAIARQSDERLDLALDPDLPAYVIYTSGSTGRPKGVVVSQAAVARLFSSTDPWFGFGPGDVWTLFHSSAFDFSVWEIWGALLYGGRLVVVPYWVSRDPVAFLDLLRREGVTVLNQTPSAFRQLVPSPPAPLPQAGEGSKAKAGEEIQDVRAVHPSPARGPFEWDQLAGGEGLRLVLFGGEALDPTMLAPWFDRHGDQHPRLANLYGITETTVHVTFRPLTREDAARSASLIGQPIPDLSLHVLDRWLQAQPLGVPGEICVGGAGLAQGYLGRPELTAERFVPDPFGAAGSRLYRSGDLARRLPDGDLEYLGRIDQQVKIRGFRIEPGEIESALAAHPAVRQAAVLALPDGAGRRLVAYVAAEEADGFEAELRRWAADRLPEPMVPSAFVVLERLPLTGNGKVDRRGLSQKAARIAPERSSGGDFVAPRTPTEAILAGLWTEVLGAERTGGRVSAHDSFFDLGGHSLLATQVASRVRSLFGVALPVRAVFEAPALADLAGRIDQLRETSPVVETPLVPLPRQGPLPVSFAQQRLWFLDRLQPGSPAYNIPSFFRLEGRLDPRLLAQVLSELVRRHESLRTTFEAPGGEPLQRIHPPAPVPMPRVDLDGLPPAVRMDEARRLARDENGRGFDLENGPLFRATLLRLEAEAHVLLVTVHHVVSDGWSTGIMAREVSALYLAFRQGLPSPLPELAVQYADFAVWQRRRLAGEALASELAFWRRRLEGLPGVLELPTDRPRPPVQGFRGALTPLRLGPVLSAALVAFGRREAATPFMTLLAAFQVLLARFAGQELFGVGTPIAGRIWTEIEPLIGFFVNTLVLRADLSAGPGFREVLRRVREESLEAQIHQELPFEKLVEGLEIERSLSHTPLFQVMFAFQNTPEARLVLPGLALVPLGALEAENVAAKFDLGLTLGQDAAGLAGTFDFSTDLFDGTTIQRLAGHFQALLEAVAADPRRDVWRVPLLGPAELHQLLVEWNDTEAPDEPLLHRLVEEQAASTPDAVAVEADGAHLTYAGLVEQAGRQPAGGIGPGAVVALAAERSPELVVQMLAVLQAGGAYLPVDPAYPAERCAFMVADAGAKDVKDLKDLKDLRDESQRSLGSFTSSTSLTSFTSFALPPTSPAYVLYTSGSTGQPKGVVVPHRAVASYMRTASAAYGLAPGDRVLQLASISFDTSVEEIWATLASGATLVLRPEEMVSSIPHFLRELERLGITVLDLPTALWHEMVMGLEAEDLALPRGVRLVVLGGEEAAADRLALWAARVGSSVRLVNTYGPTEATIVATRCELSGLARRDLVPIGRPIPGARVYVLDRFLAPVPPGVRGEVWIAGTGLARGYLGRPDLTAERFLPDPFDRTGGRLYRTGDLAIVRPDGDLVFAGRADRQLKIRGYRIEPGEIEAALRLHPAVRDAVAGVRGTGDARRLVAWIVPRDGEEAPGAADLRSFLRDRLPEPLLPAAFVPVPALPLTPSGKIDARGLQALPDPSGARPGGLEGVVWAEPRSALERTIAEIYQNLLQVSRVGRDESFFDLGGHSLLIVRAHQKLKEALGKEVPVLDLFRFPTVAGLARHLGGEEAVDPQKTEGLSEQERAARQRRWLAQGRRRRNEAGR